MITPRSPLRTQEPVILGICAAKIRDDTWRGLIHPLSRHILPRLVYFWPLIWVQILLLRAAVRAAYERGVQYHWSVSPNGRMFLTSIDWVPGQKAERNWLKPCEQFNARLAAACDGRMLMPAYAGEIAQPLIIRADTDASLSNPFRILELPLPET